ncbi:MAG: iron-containing alcohol dehydrogenase, partial [Sphingomonadales bacterium]|nr:iron-containing alcohol dehydrogenase [Sphingomonadales bacterium]
RANPMTDALCRDAIPQALPALMRLMRGEDSAARDTMAWVSLCAGLALANAGLGAVHGLAGPLGGLTGAAHGAICGRLLPAALQVNREALTRNGVQTARFDEVEGWLTAGLGGGLRGFIDANGLADLDALHCPPALWDATAQAARTASSTQANPVQLSVPEIHRILSLSA